MDTTIDKIGQFEGQTVRLKGWIYNKRSSGKIVFLQIRDGFGIIQAVAVKSQFAPEKFEEIQKGLFRDLRHQGLPARRSGKINSLEDVCQERQDPR